MIHAREDYNKGPKGIGYFYGDEGDVSKIKTDEPVMLFRAKDALTPVIPS